MFSIKYPSILARLADLPYGLMPVHLPPQNRFVLIIKATKEAILTAKLNQNIKIYMIPDTTENCYTIGLITAFFDDHDQPIIIGTPLYAEDELLADLKLLLSQPTFDLYFFDEHDRELMGVRACNSQAERICSTIKKAIFRVFDQDKCAQTWDCMRAWFGTRNADDDARGFIIEFAGTLYPDNLAFIDIRDAVYDSESKEPIIPLTTLEREDCGPFQERDIARLLRRVFPRDAVFLNPTRADSGTEVADVLCFSDELIVLIQAKDSPNTEAILRRSIDRKQATIRAHIKKAANQLRGALAYAKGQGNLATKVKDGTRTICIDDRMLCGLVIVREIFDYEYGICSRDVIAVALDTKVPCVLLDYACLHNITLYFPSPIKFLHAVLQMFDVASQHGKYPKLRFWGKPPW